MTRITLDTDEWTEIIAAGGLRHQMVRMEMGEALISLGDPSAEGFAIKASSSDVSHLFIGAGMSAFAKLQGWKAMLTVGDFSDYEPEPAPLPEDQAIVTDGDTFPADGGTVTLSVADNTITATFTPE